MNAKPLLTFSSSLALQYVSRWGRHRTSATITEQTKAAIEVGVRAQRSIKISYTNLLGAILDFVRAGHPHPYSSVVKPDLSEGQRATNAARALLLGLDPGPPSKNEALAALDQFVAFHEAFGTVVLGFAQVREAKAGGVRFRFKLYPRRTEFTPMELDAEAIRLASISNVAIETLARTSVEAFGC